MGMVGAMRCTTCSVRQSKDMICTRSSMPALRISATRVCAKGSGACVSSGRSRLSLVSIAKRIFVWPLRLTMSNRSDRRGMRVPSIGFWSGNWRCSRCRGGCGRCPVACSSSQVIVWMGRCGPSSQRPWRVARVDGVLGSVVHHHHAVARDGGVQFQRAGTQAGCPARTRPANFLGPARVPRVPFAGRERRRRGAAQDQGEGGDE